ncbi:MAG: hypothetical protein EU539_06185 [Promethearchaeota archaeon]|nr:MAG: hypothetical protein EU539_06185 [Candidatus Lokiarchaeota archaeon]
MIITTDIILNGIFSIIVVIVFLIIGLKIMLKYWESKEKVYFLTGFAWIGISEPWWPSSVGFLWVIFFGTSISLEMYVILNSGFIPLFLSCWLLAVMDIMNIKKKIVKLGAYLLIAIILESVLLYYLFTNSAIVGVLESPVDLSFGPLGIIFHVFNLTIFMISGLLFAIKTLKLDEPVDKLRGKFLLMALILFLIGALLETLINNPLNRIVVLLCSITFYIGFMMPQKIRDYFLK